MAALLVKRDGKDATAFASQRIDEDRTSQWVGKKPLARSLASAAYLPDSGLFQYATLRLCLHPIARCQAIRW